MYTEGYAAELGNSPQPTAKEYLDIQKELYNIPLQQCGLELTSSIANITANAMLLTDENAREVPDIFEKEKFERKKEFILKKPEHQRELLLDNVTLSLTHDYKNHLIGEINLFLHEHLTFRKWLNKEKLEFEFSKPHFKLHKYLNPKDYSIQQEWYKQELEKRKWIEHNIFNETLFELTKPEINMRETFETYLDTSLFLIHTGINASTFEDLMDIIEKENREKHSTG